MRFYETMFILKPTLTQEEIDAKIEFFKNILLSNQAAISGNLNMGMRNLAYEINKHKRGYYYVIYFQAEPTLIKELERNYRISEDILRFIVIKYENKTEQKTWQTLVGRANGKIVEPKKKLKQKKDDEKENLKEGSSETNAKDSALETESATE